ncbi:PAS domain-containing sensor histidine kinase [Laspinema olomoucense]|uniref:PAS domain-containing sensor histidine kinase n=1 Tax=Laspinema olomoucense TaxID=3231600 RepID=UPI0021BA4D21|nr:ATP-binding protein [Laspinema sp. D3d]MCT7973859.1 PAS domain S-box protein [Laspinema sp. D3d]
MKSGNLGAKQMIERLEAMAVTPEIVPEEIQVFFNLSRELLCIRDREGDFLKLNSSWQRVLGWSLEDLRSLSWRDLIHPDDLRRTVMSERACDIGQVSHITNRYRHKMGEYCWLSWRIIHQEKGLTYAAAQPIEKPELEEIWRGIPQKVEHQFSGIFAASLADLEAGPETALTGVSSHFQEPLNRNEQASWMESASLKAVENSLVFWRREGIQEDGKEGDNRHLPSHLLSKFDEGGGFSSLDEQSPSPLAIAQLEERFLKVNATLCEMLGDINQPLPRATQSELEPSESIDTYWHKLQQICGSTLFGNGEAQRANSATPEVQMKPSRGAIAKVPLEEPRIATDPTILALLNATTESLYLVNPQGILLASNPLAAQRLGLELPEAREQCMYDHLPDWLAQVRRNYMEQVIQTGKPVRFKEVRHTAHFEVSIYPAMDSQGEVTHLAVFDCDISDRCQREDVMGQLNAQLERRVTERTAELQSANQELEAFCYSVSHDLRAPLRAIGGFTKAVMEDYQTVLDATGKDYLHRVCTATERMNQLIDDLLSLSRVTRTQMQRKPVNLSKMAWEIATELQETQRDRPARFKFAEGLMAEGDPHLLQVMLENLLGNAWKFTSKTAHACIELGISDRPVLAEGKRVPGTAHKTVYFVRDNGAGFNMSYADKLFAPFQRLHTTSEFEGTGIGLATVSRIVKRHGGQVWATSEVNQGATFYFTL